MFRIAANLAVILLVLCANPVRGQTVGEAPLPGTPPITAFSMAEYKSNLQNWAVEQGPDGLIYVGGGMGLLQYDGVNWTRHDTPDNARVRRMLIDPQGRFWIGSTNEFGYFQREPNGAMRYHSVSDRLPEDERRFGDIRGLARVGDTIYFQALRSLFRFDGESLDRMEAWDGVFRLMVPMSDRVLVVVSNRLHDVGQWFDTPDKLPPPIDQWRWPDGARLTFLEPWPDGRILAGTYDDGLYWLSDGPPQRFKIEFDLGEVWPYVVHRREDGSILLGTRHAGLLHLSANGKLLEHISSRNGLPMDTINAIAEDDQGGVWAPQDGWITRVGLDAPIRTWGAAQNVEVTRGMTRHGGKYLLAANGGVGQLETTGTDASEQAALESPLIDGWGISSLDGTLLAAGSEGVHRLEYDLDSGALLHHERLVADHYGYRLTRSRFRPVVYAEMESGLVVLQLENDRWVNLGMVAGIDERPHHVAEDVDGRVWVGTVQSRFYLLEWVADTSELKLVATLGADQGVPEGYAWPFTLGERLVLGTAEGGYRPTLDNAGNVSGVEPDPYFGNEMLGEPRGIYKMASPDGERVIAGIGDGGALRFGWIDESGTFTWQSHPVPGIEFGQNQFLLADDHGVWAGRAPGLVHLAWPSRDEAPHAAPVYVTRSGYPEAESWLREGPGSAALLSESDLPFQKALLRFEYALVAFNNASGHTYRARLEGLDEDWSRWSPETRRDYTNLPGGAYAFQVQARDARGEVSESVPLRFEVAPPWYLAGPMWAAYLAAALILLMLTARYGHYRRERRLMARQAELEGEVAEQTREVRRQAREIRRISDARAVFFANISHELRTPLTLTRAPLEEIARSAGNLNPTQRDHLDLALRNTDAMQSLIGQVLDLHRLGEGQMPLALVRADLAAAVSSTVERFAVMADSYGVRLRVEGAEVPVQAAFDPEHIETILSNLLSNALKFAPRDSTVCVRLNLQGSGHEIEVIDAGPGVAPDARERIFERYQQAENAPQGGSGIGLALVRELVELHHGTIGVDDADGGGARFRVWLPDRPEVEATLESVSSSEHPGKAPEPAHEPETPQPETEPGAEILEKPKVLIVDDNAELRAFLRLRLGHAYQIVEAGDGREGLAQVREHLPDLVVSDGMMPVMDGLAMTSAIKADPETDFIPVLMLTARGGPDSVIRGMQAGADDYLGKPFDGAELAARLAGLIASRRRLRERLEGQASEAFSSGEGDAEATVFIRRARAIAAESLSDPEFNVRAWAALLHMDRTTLFRKFKSEAGHSPDEDLRAMRLELAARLLRDRAGNVAEVAEAVGFASVSAFSRRFRETYDTTPAAYARQN